MPISVVNSTAGGSAALVTSITTNVPAGTQANDVLIWAVYGNIATAMATPSGWNVWHQQTGTAQQWSIYWKYALATEAASYTATVASSRWSYSMVAFRGAHLTTPEGTASAGTAGTTAMAFPAITPTVAGSWVLAFGGVISASGVVTTTFSSTNLDAYVVNGATHGMTSTQGNAVNCAGSVAYEQWTAGAFTPAMTFTPTPSTRTMGVSSVLVADATVAAPGRVRRMSRRR
jgi:hypothetical protein